MDEDGKLILFILLPFALWPLTFIVLSQFFWIMMPISTTLLGLSSLMLYSDNISWYKTKRFFVLGAFSSIILYGIFWIGDKIAIYLGLGAYIDAVYNLVFTSPSQLSLAIGLIWIGFMEEVYWRGGLQGILEKKDMKYHIFIMSLIYSAVHIVTFNPILVLAAFIVGIILGETADRAGILGSIVGHVIWLELILILIPVR